MLNIQLSKTTKIVSSIVIILLIATAIFLYYRKDKAAKNSNQNEDIAIIGQDYTEKVSDGEIDDAKQSEASGTPQTNENASSSKTQSTVSVSSYTIELASLNLKAPIILNVDGNNKEDYNKALEKGVAHMAKTALPGENGNSVIFGHSSYYANKPGSYKEIFAKLDKVNVGDSIVVKAKDKSYNYKVTAEKIVPPQDTSVVKQDMQKKTLTLITCWPPKTTTNRYIVTAELN